MDTFSVWSMFSVIKDVVLFVIAIYGAVLSTFNWRQAVRKERREIVLHENKIFGTIKLTPVCEDSAGGIYKGKPRDVDPDELLQLR
jgi:hypothetical protein